VQPEGGDAVRGNFKIEDLPAGVSELSGADLDTVAGIDVIQADLQPGSGWWSSSLNNGKKTDIIDGK
jgi:hypothetical protein